jgi:hypothetical protein
MPLAGAATEKRDRLRTMEESIPHDPNFTIVPDVEADWPSCGLGQRDLRRLLIRALRGEFGFVTRRMLRGTQEPQECIHCRVPWRRRTYRLTAVGLVVDGRWTQVVEARGYLDVDS